MNRRSEQQMMELILDTARRDDRIRAVWMNGSRANPGAPRDRWQDFDIVYAVREYQSFLASPEWVDCFGPRIIMQTRSDQEEEGADFSDWYIYLMQFADGNRIDLSLVPLERAEAHFLSDRMRVLLLDKDGLLPAVPPSTDADYLPQKPSRQLFHNCCNEFWWVSTYVVKGIWRRELPYAQNLYHGAVREAFDQMACWKIGYDYGFSVNPGKCGKYFERYLPPEDWALLKETYGAGDYDALLRCLLTMGELFRRWGTELANAFGYDYPSREDRLVTAYLCCGGDPERMEQEEKADV